MENDEILTQILEELRKIRVLLTPEEKKEKKPISKEKIKSKYGFFKNILLTLEEFEKLGQDYTEKKREEAIDFLSKYKKEKAYITKDDNLTLRRWVFEAINRKQNNPAGFVAAKEGKYDACTGD